MTSARGITEALAQIERMIPACHRCAELRDYCAFVARTRRRAFAEEEYWGGPVPGFGDHRAKILIVGLAPGAHGANRTGRMFTGDRSGDFLFAALHRAGLSNQPVSTGRNDGLRVRGVYIGAALRCAPPGNRPTREQLKNCAPFLAAECRALKPRTVLCLGGIAWNAALGVLASSNDTAFRRKPKFAHGHEVEIGDATLLGCYHVSQQNTFTGRLTECMIDKVLMRARSLAEMGYPE